MSRGKRTEALARPAMPAAPTPMARPARQTRRFTIDLPVSDHQLLRQWSVEAEVPASLIVLALLELADNDPTIRLRATATAVELMSARRSVGQ